MVAAGGGFCLSVGPTLRIFSNRRRHQQNKLNKKKEKSMETKLNSQELKEEMLSIIEKANTPEQINFLINTRQKIVETSGLKEKYTMRLAELRGLLKEKFVATDVGSIEVNFKKRKKMESE